MNCRRWLRFHNCRFQPWQLMLGLQVRSRSAQLSGLSRTAANRCKPLPLQPIGSACPSTRSGYAVPCGASLHALAWHFARHQAVAKRKQGRILCDGFAQRQGLGWNPSMDSCPDLQTLRFAHRECSKATFRPQNGSSSNFVLSS